MPHTTHAYPFEARVGAFAGELSARFTSDSSLRSFVLMLTPEGNVTSLSFEDGSHDWPETARALCVEGVPHLFYDPLDDGMEHIWLSWQGIQRSVMERLMGQSFENADFVPIPAFVDRAENLPQDRQFPPTWNVMF